MKADKFTLNMDHSVELLTSILLEYPIINRININNPKKIEFYPELRKHFFVITK